MLLVAALLALCVGAPPAQADGDDLTVRGEATAGARLYFLENPFDDDDLTGYFDQYRYIETKNDDPAWFADVFHLDLGWYRDDGTSLLRFERTSPNWDNEHDLLQADWRGLDFDFDYRRYRSSSLRVYPDDTTGPYPTADDALAVRFNPDTSPDNPLGLDKTLWKQRTGFESELALRPDGFGIESKGFDELHVDTRYQERNGKRQDRYLLDESELGQNGSYQRSRFRAQRTHLDQEVHGVGGGLVLTPGGLFTAALDVDFETFREEAPEKTVGGLEGTDPELGTGFSPETAAHGIFNVPNTDRLGGSLLLSRRIGGATLQAGASISTLRQSGGESSLQSLLNLDDTGTTTWSAHGAFDVPLWDSLGANGFVKFVSRRNDFNQDDLGRIDSTEGQVDAFMRRRRETTARLEATWQATPGLQMAAGWTLDMVKRTLFTGDAPAILPSFSLQNDDSETHVFYLRSNARLRRYVRLQGEVGAEYAPDVAYPRDLKRAYFVDGRVWGTLPGTLPVSLSAHGRVRQGKNDAYKISGETQTRTKSFERLEWSYDITLDAQPHERVALFAAWSESYDQQKFPFLRSTIPRYFGPDGLEFYRDSNLDYDSRMRNLTLGSRLKITSWIDGSVSTSLLWVNADFDSDGDGRTGDRIDDVKEIDSLVASVDTGIGFDLSDGFRLDLGYRFDDYVDERDHDPLQLDETVHTATLSVTWRFGGGPDGGS